MPQAAPPPAAVAAAVPESLPAARRRHREEEAESRPEQIQGRKIFGFAAAVGIVAIGAFLGVKYLGSGGQAGEKKEDAPVVQPVQPPPATRPAPKTQPPVEQPPVAKAPASQPPAPVVERPSPSPPARPPAVPSKPPAATASGGVQIFSSPPGAAVVIDNDPSLACTTPCNLNLPAGRHTMVASLDGYRRAPKIFTLPQESSMSLTLERMMGRLSVRTTPPGATIYVNGEPREEKTPAIFSLAAGKYRITVVKEGLPKQEDEVVVRDGGIADLEWNWGQK
jgi:hypothetical protein